LVAAVRSRTRHGDVDLNVGVVDVAQVEREDVVCIRIEDERGNVLVDEGGVRPPKIQVGIPRAERDAVTDRWAVRKDRDFSRPQGRCALRTRPARDDTCRDRHASDDYEKCVPALHPQISCLPIALGASAPSAALRPVS